jgi:hypothetical protein
MKRLLKHASELYAAGVPVVLAGDYNVVPSAQDIYPTKSYEKDALVQPQPAPSFGSCSTSDGWMQFALSNLLHPSTRTGITRGTDGLEMRAFGLITCCLVPKPPSGSEV